MPGAVRRCASPDREYVMSERIFLDGAAGLPVRAEVVARIQELLSAGIANPNGGHVEARRSRALLDGARDRIAAHFGARPADLVFTGTASEALSLALGSELRADTLLVTTAGEHRGARALAARHTAQGGHIRLVPLTSEGRWDLEAFDLTVDGGLRGATALLAATSGELGTIQPLATFVEAWRAAGGGAIILDGVQGSGTQPLDLRTLGVTHLVIGAAKLEGPVGISALISAPGATVRALVPGGGQERGRRGGTEAVILADAFALAVQLALDTSAPTSAYVRELARHFDTALGDPAACGFVVTGPRQEATRAAGHRSYAASWALGDDLVAALDHEGLAVSTGSACLSGSREPSEALRACGFDEATARGGLRLTFGRNNTPNDALRAAAALRLVASRLRHSAVPSATGPAVIAARSVGTR